MLCHGVVFFLIFFFLESAALFDAGSTVPTRPISPPSVDGEAERDVERGGESERENEEVEQRAKGGGKLSHFKDAE